MAKQAVALSWRGLVTATAMLVLVPLAVASLVRAGLAGSWQWLPVCVLLVPGVTGACALALWWRHRRLRVVSVAACVAWASFALSVAYWPHTLTPADLEAAIDRVDYAGGSPSDTWGSYCFPWQQPWSCPFLTKAYQVDDGQADDVLAAIEAAGFEPVGAPRDVAPPIYVEGVAQELDFRGHGLRMIVTVVTEREYVTRDSLGTTYLDAPGETVDIKLLDDRCPTRSCGLLDGEPAR
jgi:hypothetical protein